MYIEILSNPEYSNVKSVCIISFSRFIQSNRFRFVNLANFIFDIYTQSMSLDEIAYEFINLSNLYGGNEDFARHAFEFLQNNVPDPKSFIAFSSSFKGMKKHFINSNMSNNLLEMFTLGFTSEDDFTRYIAFDGFKEIIQNVDVNEEWCQCSQKICEVVLNVITAENNPDSLLKEIKLLSKLLEKFSLQYSEDLENITIFLDQLSENYPQIEYQNELFQCYKYLASSYKDKFLPFSENFGSRMLDYISNPESDEYLFFKFIDILPEFSESFPQEFFDNLMKYTFHFLFTAIYDENGNENEELSLSDISRSKIINFLLSCLQKRIIDDSFDLIETILKVAFNIAGKDLEFEKVSRNDEIEFTQDSNIFSVKDEIIIIEKDQYILIENSIKILTLIFKENEQIILQYIEDILKLSFKLLQTPYFSMNPILNEVYELLKFDFMFVSEEETLNNLLILSLAISFDKNNPGYDTCDYQPFTKYFVDLIRISGNRFHDEPQQIPGLLQNFYNFLNYMASILALVSEICHLKQESFLDIKYHQNHENALINIALGFREIFRYFPNFGASNMAEIISFISQGKNNKVKSIIFSDLIYYSPEEVPQSFSHLFDYFNGGLENQNQEIQFDSIYGLAIILTPQYFNQEVMKWFIDNLLENFHDAQNDIKNVIVFFLLQAIKNYNSFFDVSDRFWELFDESICMLPNYCMEYLIQSLEFLVSNFHNEIPDEKETAFQDVIQNIKENSST